MWSYLRGGAETIRLATDFLSKNCRGVIKSRSFATAGRINNGKKVAAFKMLLDKGNTVLDRVFQRVHPSFSPSNRFWFMKSPLGHNLLGQMMSRISESATLSKRYTNHCLRATCVTSLIKSCFPVHQVCEVTGHKNAAGLASYSRADAEDRAKMAIAIDHVIQEAPSTDSATHNQEEPVPEQATVKRERRESTGGDDHEQSFFALPSSDGTLRRPCRCDDFKHLQLHLCLSRAAKEEALSTAVSFLKRSEYRLGFNLPSELSLFLISYSPLSGYRAFIYLLLG